MESGGVLRQANYFYHSDYILIVIVIMNNFIKSINMFIVKFTHHHQ